MQKGKHQGGQTQGYSHRSYQVYPGNPDTARQYAREVPTFHASGTPGGGPGMRGMHHAPPAQPPTPPTSQDMKQPPTHLPPQSHQMPPQSGGQIMQYTMTGAGRGNGQQTPFYNPQRGPSGVQRMPPHPRPPVIMPNNPQQFLHQQTMQSVYPSSLVSQVSGQPPVFVTPHMNHQSFQIPAQPRHQGNFYPPQPFVLPPTHHIFQGQYQQMYYSPQIPQMSRQGGPAPNSQAATPHPQQAGMTVMRAAGTMVSPPRVSDKKRKIIEIIDPVTRKNILADLEHPRADSTTSKSSDGSARQTSRPSSEQKTDPSVVAEFATRVAIAARSDQSISPNSPALHQAPSSRASSYSENESQASPDMQGVSSSKMEVSVENMPSESQIVETNMTYDTNQQAGRMRPGWTQVMAPVDLMPVSNYSGMIISEDLMRGGGPPAQSSMEFQPQIQTQWIPDPNTVPVIINNELPVSMDSGVRSGPERVTPVVSALAHGPTVDLGPRHQREQFPALGKGHQQMSPSKRKHRAEAVPQQEQQPSQPQSVEKSVKETRTSPTPPSASTTAAVTTTTTTMTTASVPQPQTAPQSHQVKSGPQSKSKQTHAVTTAPTTTPTTPTTPVSTVAVETTTTTTKKQQQQQQQQQPQQPQQPPATPQDEGDGHVQLSSSVQAKSADPKTVSIKTSEGGGGESSETKVRSNVSLSGKESGGSDATRNTSDDGPVAHDSRKGAETGKSSGGDVMQHSESHPTRSEDSGSSRASRIQKSQAGGDAHQKQEVQRAISPVDSELKANGEVTVTVAGGAEDATTTGQSPISTESSKPSKSNCEGHADDAKQNNQKQKSGNKRQAQSKMRLEKEAWNVEQQHQQQQQQQPSETVANEVSTAPATPPTATPTVLPESKSPTPPVTMNNNNDQTEEPQEETTVNEEDKDEDPIVAAKNKENNKQTAAVTNDTAPGTAPTAQTSGGVAATNPPAVESVNKVVSKHNYQQDQWSPSNPEGKKKYDKDFIMGLKFDPQSMKRPANLPHPELFRDSTKQRPPDRSFLNPASRDSNDIGSLFPSFGNKNPVQRSSQILQKKGSQTSKPKGTKPSVIHVFYSQDVKLHETENAWKPSRNSTNKDLTEEEIKTEELTKRARGVLNKLTPERFGTLVNQFKALPIDNQERLNKIIDLVFEKAVDEPNFSVAYAQMCNNIQDHKVPTGATGPDGKPLKTTFRKLLLTKCQKEFEKDMSAELKKREETLKEIELETDPEKKKLMQLNYEESERRVRMKSVGISRFIGELFKLNMLTIPIMHSCISRLLNEGHEESLECLCKLLTTIGRDFEKKVVAEGKSSTDGKDVKKNDTFNDLSCYFKKLADIAKNKGSKKVSSRVRFMIQDLIDLRSNKWVPRRDDAVPKTIDQIHKEAERETMEMNIALNSSQDRNKRQDSRNSLDNRKRGGADSSGWQLVTQQNRKQYVVETSKLKLDQSDVNLGFTVSLGNRNLFLTWGQGSGSGKMDKKLPGSNNNMYSVLGDNTLTHPSSRNSGLKGPSISSEKERMFSSYKSNYEDDGRSSRSGSQQGPDSRSSSRDSASSKHDDRGYVNASGKAHLPSSKSSSHTPPNVVDDAKTMEVLQQKTKLLIQEYMNFPDLKETEFCVEQLRSTAPMPDVVAHIVRNAMDMKGSSPKRAVGEIMNHLIKKNIITKGQYLEGLSRTLEVADDLVIDMPLIWLYFAEVILDVIIEGNLTFRDLADLLTSRQGTPVVVKLLSSLFKLLVDEKTAAWVGQKWSEDDVNLTDFIDPSGAEKFVKDTKLEFLLEKNTESIKKESIKNELYKMISSRTSFDSITEWIDENVPPKKRATPEFIKALMTALLEATIIPSQSSYKFDLEFFSNYEQLIIRHTDHSEELELPCLYAVQAFLHKLEFPQGLVLSVFEYLWDQELIAAESFTLWRQKEPQEVEGHAVCVTSLNSFFTHLSESMTDDES